jgi:cell fate regulator YaaT (PSP1 superfamily)
MAESAIETNLIPGWTPPASLEHARALARERFKSRLQAGEEIGGCGCDSDSEVVGPQETSAGECVVGVRFPDSGRVYYFRPGEFELTVGDWVVVPTGRGQEAARVVIAPHQVRSSLLDATPSDIVRPLEDDDVARIDTNKRKASEAVRLFGQRVRAQKLGMKPIAADYNFDCSSVNLSYSVPDRDLSPDNAVLRDLAKQLAAELTCRVELRQVGPRDEARLLGGLGRCGRTLCCSSWLPVFPEISMNMAKNQELPLNPSKVSGVCGRLLCCLSYENEQYRRMKAVMPKLGQTIETPNGTGQVISMQLLKELVTVRLQDDTEATFRSDELGLDSRGTILQAEATVKNGSDVSATEVIVPGLEPSANEEPSSASRRRRRRRQGRGGQRPSGDAGRRTDGGA